MISSHHRFIYLHVPKTGGNSIQSALLPYGDDEKVRVAEVQDGVDRFEVRGPITRSKHSALQPYIAALGEAVRNYRIVISVRHPFDRAISYYFSPSRWLRVDRDGRHYTKTPTWDRARFMEVVGEMTPIVGYLALGDNYLRPSHVIRYENMDADFAGTVAALGLPAEAAHLPHLNRSAAEDDLRAEVAADAGLRAEVESMFPLDMRMFGYADRAAASAGA